MPWLWPCNLYQKVYLKPAQAREDFEQAFSLICRCSNGTKIKEVSPSNLCFSPHHALPETRVLLSSLVSDSFFTTGTVVFDSVEMGLPADQLYKDYIDKLRGKGRYLVEFIHMVSLVSNKARSSVEFFHLFRVLYRYAVIQGATDLILCVVPKEAAFFEKVFLFRRLGPLRACASCSQGGYTVLIHLNLEEAPRVYAQAFKRVSEDQNLYKFLLEDPLPLDLKVISTARLKKEDFVFFFLEKTNFWVALSEEERAYFGYLYNLTKEWADFSVSSKHADLLI